MNELREPPGRALNQYFKLSGTWMLTALNDLPSAAQCLCEFPLGFYVWEQAVAISIMKHVSVALYL